MNGMVKAISAVVMIAAAGAMFYLFNDGTRLGDREYYYDLSAGKLFINASGQRPPIDGVDGDETDGVRAVVIACGSCSKKQRRIAYLEKYTPELIAALEEADRASERREPPPANAADRLWITEQTLVRRPDESQWVSKSSPEGQAVIAVVSKECPDGSYPLICNPDG